MQAIALELYNCGYIKESLQCYCSIMDESTLDLLAAATLLVRHCPENPLASRAVSKLLVSCKSDHKLYFNVLDLQIKLNPTEKLISKAISEARADPTWFTYFSGCNISPYEKITRILALMSSCEFKTALELVVSLHSEIETCPEAYHGTLVLENGNTARLLTKDQLYALVYLISALAYKPSNPAKSMAFLEQSLVVIDRNANTFQTKYKNWFEVAHQIATDQLVQCQIITSQFSLCKKHLSQVSQETRDFFTIATTGCGLDLFQGKEGGFYVALRALHAVKTNADLSSQLLMQLQDDKLNPAANCLVTLASAIRAFQEASFLSAKTLFLKCLKQNESIGSVCVKMVVLGYLGDLYVLNEPRQALVMYNKAMQFAEFVGDDEWKKGLKAKILDIEMI